MPSLLRELLSVQVYTQITECWILSRPGIDSQLTRTAPFCSCVYSNYWVLHPFKTFYAWAAYSESSFLFEYKLKLLSAQSFQDRSWAFSLLREPTFCSSLHLNYLGSILSRPTRRELLTYWALRITELAPFCSPPFSFPSCSRQDSLFGHVVTLRAWGVKSGVHYIAFWQGAPLRNNSRLRTFQ